MKYMNARHLRIKRHSKDIVTHRHHCDVVCLNKLKFLREDEETRPDQCYILCADVNFRMISPPIPERILTDTHLKHVSYWK